MGVLTATVRYPGGGPAAKLTTGSQAPRNMRRQQATPRSCTHFIRPRMPAEGGDGQLTPAERGGGAGPVRAVFDLTRPQALRPGVSQTPDVLLAVGNRSGRCRTPFHPSAYARMRGRHRR